MNQINYRSFQPGDSGQLVDLIARGMPTDAVSAEWFAEWVLLEPNFDPDGLIVAEDARTTKILGFVYAVRSQNTPGVPVDPTGGWITIGVVDPAARRQGIGTRLAERAKEFLRAGGSEWVVYSGYPPAYFLPGLDAETYPDGLRLLQRAGFETVSQPVAMDLSLGAYRQPEAVVKLRADREAEGYTFAPATADDIPEVITFANRELAPDWGEVIRQAVVRSGRPRRVVMSRRPDGVVVGFAIYGAFREITDRFGPFGVADGYRGLGLGKILLHTTLEQMRAEGAHSAWFLWTGTTNPAGRLYLSTGFSITRTFHVMRAGLSAAANRSTG
ncbi:GNAT family N-acetyltransferase [Phytoactinopolyspora mesophila]|uniref:GNAT family N-acetyltransferase n=1 Tax=Phytoactinopolyspora mesophila TaxID=2650750 RepID=A0A7K3M4X7_9ACTN|nr:GNAT family N-acetyltransferase [Phytoactinopolyspora mesophila]NDL58354.1 GNAT family N-acetyltransferase [Phytoactinopolyspora mesophila]